MINTDDNTVEEITKILERLRKEKIDFSKAKTKYDILTKEEIEETNAKEL